MIFHDSYDFPFVINHFSDDYFAMKKCCRVDLRILNPKTMPDSMKVIVEDIKGITKLIKEDVITDISLIICTPPNSGEFQPQN